MKKLLPTVCLVLLVSPAARPQTEPRPIDRGLPSPPMQLLDVLDRRVAAMLKNDFAALEALLDDALVYTHSSGRVETKAEFIAALRSGQLKYVAADLDDLRVRIYGSTALVTGHARMTVESGGRQRVLEIRFLDVYLRRDARWRQVAWQSTRIADQ